jgi:Tetracyclin repressor-like, C-terminal domain
MIHTTSYSGLRHPSRRSSRPGCADRRCCPPRLRAVCRHLDIAWNDGQPDPFAAFENIGRACLTFARDKPAYYSAMFEAGLSFDDDPALRQTADRSFAVLRHASETLCARLSPEKRPLRW